MLQTLQKALFLALALLAGDLLIADAIKTEVFYPVVADDMYAPVAKSVNPQPGTYLRTPNMQSEALTSLEPTRTNKTAKALPYKKQQHRFNALTVEGRVRIPRLNFMQQEPTLIRIPDELPNEFLSNPFANNGDNQ